jgi:hypothetical protein
MQDPVVDAAVAPIDRRVLKGPHPKRAPKIRPYQHKQEERRKMYWGGSNGGNPDCFPDFDRKALANKRKAHVLKRLSCGLPVSRKSQAKLQNE